MNKELSVILRDKIADAPYLERLSGLVQVFEKTIAVDGEAGRTIKKKIPVTSFATFQECESNNQAQVAMVPNSKYKGILYFEDGGINTPTPSRGGMQYISRLRLVCWLNTKLITGQTDMSLTTRVIADILGRFAGNPFNVSPFTKIAVKVANIPAQDKSIFSPYDYSEAETQYLMAPFEYFALDLNISYTIPFLCVTDISVTEDPNTCL